MISLTRAAAYGGLMAALCVSGTAHAATYTATNANFRTVFAKARPGDTIVLSGQFGSMVLQDRSFKTPVKIDATNARFNGAVSIRRVDGVSFTGGRFGNGTGTWQNSGTVIVSDSANVRFTNPVLVGDGKGRARGIFFMNSRDFNVSGGTYTGFRLALGTTGSRDGSFINNRITRSTSDGINISDSQRILARGNSCSGGIPSEGAHADCIQLWSIAGRPVQSDIQLLYNISKGVTQGFTSFDPDKGGGIRISMIGNRVESTYAHGLACYNCFDSIFTDNILTTLPGGTKQTRINIFGGGNNLIANNRIDGRWTGELQPPARRGASAMMLGELGSFDASSLEADGFELESEFDDFSWAWAIANADPSQLPQGTAVPEPAAWLQLLAGFALLGAVARRRSAQALRQKAC